MIDAVFISDLHLHPNDEAIQHRFEAFIAWAKTSVQHVYILGDFFHSWAGDDALDQWSEAIALQLHGLVDQGIKLFYMHGNRDFLLGDDFAARAGWTVLHEPTTIKLGNEQLLLAHGDRYCTKDKAHQRFRRLTRNKWFPRLFLRLPLNVRNKLVNKARAISKQGYATKSEQMDVVHKAVVQHMVRHKVHTLIHGHTHQPSVTRYEYKKQQLKRYVLSDWDDTPRILCYHNTIGLYFIQI